MRLDMLRLDSLMVAGIFALGVLSGSAAADPQFGMIGLAAGETLRLNVVAYPPNPCVAQIGFRDANGALPQPIPTRS